MAKGINKALIIGNCVSDPEVRYTTGGAQITNIRVATNESWKDKQTGEMREKAEYHRITFFGRLAEIAGQYLKKGSQVYVEGRIETQKYQAADGSDRYSTSIIASQMQMLGGKSGSTSERSQPAQQAASPPPAADFDDDIPF